MDRREKYQMLESFQKLGGIASVEDFGTMLYVRVPLISIKNNATYYNGITRIENLSKGQWNELRFEPRKIPSNYEECKVFFENLYDNDLCFTKSSFFEEAVNSTLHYKFIEVVKPNPTKGHSYENTGFYVQAAIIECNICSQRYIIRKKSVLEEHICEICEHNEKIALWLREAQQKLKWQLSYVDKMKEKKKYFSTLQRKKEKEERSKIKIKRQVLKSILSGNLKCDSTSTRKFKLFENLPVYKVKVPRKYVSNLEYKRYLYIVHFEINGKYFGKYGISYKPENRFESFRAKSTAKILNFWIYEMNNFHVQTLESELKCIQSHYISKDIFSDGYTETFDITNTVVVNKIKDKVQSYFNENKFTFDTTNLLRI